MKPWLWIDLEMSGLDEKKDKILEVAAIITDDTLSPKAEFHRIVHQPQSVLDGMDKWCTKTHTQSGLVEAVKTGMPLSQVEDEMMSWISLHFRTKDALILAGNSIGNDRRFVEEYMPKLSSRLHYRVLDVSSWKIVFKDFYGLQYQKKGGHRALDDILESINELKFYLTYVKKDK